MHQFVSSPKIRRKKKKGGIHSFFEVISREVWCLDQSSEERKVCMEYFLSNIIEYLTCWRVNIMPDTSKPMKHFIHQL